MLPTSLLCAILLTAVVNGDTIGEQWSVSLDYLGELQWPLKPHVIQFLENASSSTNLTATCRRSLQLYADNLRTQTPWAIESESVLKKEVFAVSNH